MGVSLSITSHLTMGAIYSYNKPSNLRDYVYTRNFTRSLPNLSGKVFAVTGTSVGSLGFATVKTLLEKGARIICLNRWDAASDKGKEFINALKALGSDAVLLVRCDLLDLTSVRAAAAEVRAMLELADCHGLDALFNNAGIMAMADERTKEGFEIQMLTNHTSHFLLTKLLLPELERAAERTGEARIVNITSEGRKGPPFNDLNPKSFQRNVPKGGLGNDTPVGRLARYQQSKLANCAFTYALDEKLRSKNSKVKALLCHPGLSASNLQVATAQDSDCLSFLLALLAWGMQSLQDGSVAGIRCLCDADLASGSFLGPTQGMGWMRGPPELITPEAKLKSSKNLDTLWAESEAAVGERFEI